MSAAAPLALRRRIEAAAVPLRRALVVDHVLGALREALALDPHESLDAQVRFAALGIDSRRALELKEDLDDALGCVLPTTLFFDHPTPERLAAFVVERLFGVAAAAPPAGAAAARDAPGDESENDDEDLDAALARTLRKYDL